MHECYGSLSCNENVTSIIFCCRNIFVLQIGVRISIFTLKCFLLSYFLGPLYFRRGLQSFLTADETIFWRVSYFVSQVRLTHVGFLEWHRNLLVSVTYSGSFNPEEWAVSVVGWYYSNVSYFFYVGPGSFCPWPPECDCPSPPVSAPVSHLR